jgi:hypothetical protein
MLALTSYGRDIKLAQTGFQFLSVGLDGRGSALANAMTTVDHGSGALFYNPAGVARQSRLLDVSLGQNRWIDNIQYNYGSVTVSPFGGRYGVLGLSVVSVDYGEVQGTMVWGNEQGYIDTEILEPSALSLGIGYGKALTDKFTVGGQVKVVSQSLGTSLIPSGEGGTELKVKSNVLATTAVDFGTIYRTGFRSLVFGMSVNNFSREVKYEQEQFELPLTFKIGMSLDVLDLVRSWVGPGMSMLVSVDALHPRDYPEQLNVGLEYGWQDRLYLRGGYMLVSDEQSVSLGFGLRLFGLGIDYAYAPFGVFDKVQMFTIRLSY